MRSVIQEIDMGKQIQLIKYPATQVASCDVPRAKLDIDYMTNKAVLSSTLPHRMVRSLRKCGGQATIFKALKF